ncbi:MAG: hypothetical protein OXB84_08040 [Halobacteriovoraceae bacterium]|nr:hypothetical protein [Halobacteriovoraceae bacterium]
MLEGESFTAICGNEWPRVWENFQFFDRLREPFMPPGLMVGLCSFFGGIVVKVSFF